jgi:hypothetical protein
MSRWSDEELATLERHYPADGIDVAARLPGRSPQSIYVQACKHGISSSKTNHVPRLKLSGEDLETAIYLYEIERWGFGKIGKHFGVAETSASNAVLMALCLKRGHRPAERDSSGRLTAEGLERLRYALRIGMKGTEITLRLAISAAAIAEQRRRYNTELKSRGKAPLQPHGRGDRYSGAKISAEDRKAVEALLMQGFGAMKIEQRTRISKTTVQRIRTKLVKRLKAKGETLPGCDDRGRRHVQAESSRFIPEESRQLLRKLLLDRVPVARAAKIAAIGSCSAYRIRDEFAAQLNALGKSLPKPLLPGRSQRRDDDDPHWPPSGPLEINRFRAMLRDAGFDEAKAAYRAQQKEAAHAERTRPKSFDEILQLVGASKVKIVENQPRRHLEPTR